MSEPDAGPLPKQFTGLVEDVAALRVARDAINLYENDVPKQQCILRLTLDTLGSLNRLIRLTPELVSALTAAQEARDEALARMERMKASTDRDELLEQLHASEEARAQLRAALEEMRAACAAAMRVLDKHDLAEEFVFEAKFAGVTDGFGVRAAAALAASASEGST